MERQKTNFKNMKADELLKHFAERKAMLDKTQAEILDCRHKLEVLRKLEMLEVERLRTVTHWISAKYGQKIDVKRV